jgi:hypothetical protein
MLLMLARKNLTGFAVFGLIAWGMGLTSQSSSYASEPEAPNAKAEADKEPVDFGREIRPILAKRCFHCHGPDIAESNLRLNSQESAFAEADSGMRPIVPGKPDQSELIARISETDESLRMPPEGKPLTKEEIETFQRWIAGGAKFETYWAFQPMKDPQPPQVKNAGWVANPIDAFILHRLEQSHLEPAPPADKTALVRRVYYDLTGLPPTPEQVDAFINDNSPGAYESLIDQLLDSSRYGEQWGRHWLDLVRFAETNSFERDGVKPNAWRYRDYVIESFNEDKPYDQFIREQLAGDELPEVTTGSIIATGYYRLGLWDDEPADPLLSVYNEFDDIITTTSQVFLGLTVNCARCHDHKIDPIPQADYYSMLAFFHDLTPYGTRGDQTGNNQTDITPPDIAAQYQSLDKRKNDLQPKLREIEQAGIAKMTGEDQRRTEGRERDRILRRKLRDYLSEEEWNRYRLLQEQFELIEAEYKKLPTRESALSVAKVHPQPKKTFIMLRGNPTAQGDKVEPAFPSLFSSPMPTLPERPEGARSSGRRLALADWIASPDNLLTSRVMANRVWQYHFGRGIVRSSNNFGQLGDPPTHPLLLDWLAHRFIENGWKLKPMHKLIMMSNAYRMSSKANEKALAQDPANNLFWRFDLRRLSAEEVRDSIHAVTGVLNLKMHGPGVYPTISKEVLAGQSQPGSGWGKSPPEEQARRSIYIHVKRSLITPLLEDFDGPDTDNSCPVRFTTTQPTQALAMLNGDFVNAQAQVFAERLRKEAGDNPEDQIALAIRLTTCRPATKEDIDRGLKLMKKLQLKHSLNQEEALKYYCLLALNTNEFFYLD